MVAVISADSSPRIRPSLSVLHGPPFRRKNDAPALSSPPKPSEPSSKPFTNHLKPTGTSTSRLPRAPATRSMMLLDTSVLPTPASAPPTGPVFEKILDRYGEIMIRVQQPGAARHNAMAVMIRIAGERHVEAILQRDQRRHRVRGGTVHADLAVPIERHEAERGIDIRIDYFKIQAVLFGDARPVGDAGAPQRIDTQFQLRG